MTDKLSRREKMQQAGALGALVVLGGACSKPALHCTDTSSLSEADQQVRTALAYVDSSTEPGKVCNGCQQFLPPPQPGTCGSCKVIKGPVNPNGNCKSFVAKTT